MEILVIIWLLCGVLCYFIMKSKGYDNNTCLTHGVGGVLLGFIWLIVVLCKKDNNNVTTSTSDNGQNKVLSNLESVELLERLANLKERGVITEAEYRQKKSAVFQTEYDGKEDYIDGKALAALNREEIAECAYMDKRCAGYIAFPNGLQKIGSFAFFGCADLCCIEIPASVTVVGYQAFGGCTNLSEVTISRDTKFLNRENLPEGSFEDSFDGCAPDMKVNWI